MATLYVVGTPIGNLEDVTLRALKVLASVDVIAAEDTRRARKLLSAHGITARLLSYHEHNRAQRIPQILALLQHQDVALISEAGTPGLSDPGVHLVAAAAAAGIPVQTVPGASAVVAALAVAGLPAHRFLFLGFLPPRPGPRRRLLQSVAAMPYTLVLFEAPHRLRGTLADLAELLGPRPLIVAREMTKLHEELFRGNAEEALQHFGEPKGEFTLAVAGATKASPTDGPEAWERAIQEVEELRGAGLAPAAAVARVARALALPRRSLYQRWQRRSS